MSELGIEIEVAVSAGNYMYVNTKINGHLLTRTSGGTLRFDIAASELLTELDTGFSSSFCRRS